MDEWIDDYMFVLKVWNPAESAAQLWKERL